MPIKPPTFRPPGWTPAPNKRREAHDPYYGTQAWKRMRARVLERDGYRCTASDCSTPPCEVPAADWSSTTLSSVATAARIKFRTCAACARPVTTVATAGGVGGSKSLQILGVRPAMGNALISAKFRNFFLLSERGRGVGGGGSKLAREEDR